jgi:hypothetical protein
VNRGDVYALIDLERAAQSAKWSDPHPWGVGDCSSSQVRTPTKVMVLTEEVGEVARAVLDGDEGQLRRELVQVAAVAVAWLEGMNT